MDDSKIIELYMERSEQAISETSKKYGRYGLSESKVTVTLFRTRGKLKSVLEKEGITL